MSTRVVFNSPTAFITVLIRHMSIWHKSIGPTIGIKKRRPIIPNKCLLTNANVPLSSITQPSGILQKIVYRRLITPSSQLRKGPPLGKQKRASSTSFSTSSSHLTPSMRSFSHIALNACTIHPKEFHLEQLGRYTFICIRGSSLSRTTVFPVDTFRVLDTLARFLREEVVQVISELQAFIALPLLSLAFRSVTMKPESRLSRSKKKEDCPAGLRPCRICFSIIPSTPTSQQEPLIFER